MLVVALVKLTILYFALVGSIRARLALGIAVAVVMIYMPIAILLAAIPPHFELPGSGFLTANRWVYLVVDAGLGIGPMIVASRRAKAARDNLDLRPHLERTRGAYIANTILDAAALAIFVIFGLIAARQSP